MPLERTRTRTPAEALRAARVGAWALFVVLAPLHAARADPDARASVTTSSGVAAMVVEQAAPPPTSVDVVVDAWRARLLALRALDAPLPSLDDVDARSPRAARRHQIARALGMPGAPLVEPCVARAGPACVERALDRFFARLDGLDARRVDPTDPGAATSHVRVLAMGNSLIASDHITDVVRERLVDRFGDGGRGYVLVDRMAPYGRRTRTAARAHGLTPLHIALPEPGTHPYGIAGVLHLAETRATSRLVVDGATRARVFWLDYAKSEPLALTVDGRALAPVVPSRDGRARDDVFDIDAGARHLDLVLPRGTVVYGASLERAEPGVILDTLGVPAADSGLFLDADDAIASAQVRALDPSLLLFVLGGNEIKRYAWGRKSLDDTVHEARAFLSTMRARAPDAACLVVGPIENVLGGEGDDRFVMRRQTLIIDAALRQVAHEQGCATFDTFGAMGGRGALKRLSKSDLLHDDLVHPRGPALDAIGELVVTALLDAHARRAALVAMNAREAWGEVVRGLQAEPSGLAHMTTPVDVFVAGSGAETRALERALSRTLHVPVARHRWPVRPVGLVVEVRTPTTPEDPYAPVDEEPSLEDLDHEAARSDDDAPSEPANDGKADDARLRVLDGQTGQVLAEVPLDVVTRASSSETHTRGARAALLASAARVLIASVVQAERPTLAQAPRPRPGAPVQ